MAKVKYKSESIVNGDIAVITKKINNGSSLQSLISKGYKPANIKAACKKKETQIIKKELANANSKTYKTLITIFGTAGLKKHIKRDVNTCVSLIKAGANMANLKSLGFTESMIVDACLRYKSKSTIENKIKFVLKLNNYKDSKTLKALCKKKIKGFSDKIWTSTIKKHYEDTHQDIIKVRQDLIEKIKSNEEYKNSNTAIKADSPITLKNLYKAVSSFYLNKDTVTGKDIDKEEENFNHAIRSNMITYDNHRAWGSAFNRMQHANPYIGVSNVREYLFFTKPDLGIINPSTKDNTARGLRSELRYSSFWNEMFHRYRRVISDLQVSARRTNPKYAAHDRHVFIPLLTNAVNSQLELPSVSADTSETSQTIYGTSLQYRKSSVKSDEGYDFSLDFIDAPWLDVYHFFKMWDEYETLKDLGYIGPPQFDQDNAKVKTTGYYRVNKILHDQISIYKFVVDGDDMETILFYAKLIGCFPKSVPRDTFSSFKGDGYITYSVDWHAQFVEDMNPNILYEFNELCYSYFGGTPKQKKRSYVPLYSEKYSEINGGFRNHPFIVQTDSHQPNTSKYLLKWYD